MLSYSEMSPPLGQLARACVSTARRAPTPRLTHCESPWPAAEPGRLADSAGALGGRVRGGRAFKESRAPSLPTSMVLTGKNQPRLQGRVIGKPLSAKKPRTRLGRLDPPLSAVIPRPTRLPGHVSVSSGTGQGPPTLAGPPQALLSLRCPPAVQPVPGWPYPQGPTLTFGPGLLCWTSVY